MGKHNKKRNVGLIHEQLVRQASQLTVEGNTTKANKIIDLIIQHFNQQSELLKEYKLFGALIYSKVDDRDTAKRIIEESKKICRNHNTKKLNVEKSKLISDINKKINNKDFYNQKISDYKLFATVQTLINEWRGNNKLDAYELVNYEKQLEDHLIRKNNVELLVVKENADPLVLNLMTKKFNEKYNNILNEDQKLLLQSKLNGNDELLIATMAELKKRTKKTLTTFFENCDNKVLESKKLEVLQKIDNFEPKNTSDYINKALIMANLLQEIS
jgi:hypothetical protein